MTNFVAQKNTWQTRISLVKWEVLLAIVIFVTLSIAYYFRLDIKNFLALDKRPSLNVFAAFLINFMLFIYFYSVDKLVSVIFRNFEDLLNGLTRNLLFGFCLSFYSALYSKNYPFRVYIISVTLITVAYVVVVPLILMLYKKASKKVETPQNEIKNIHKEQNKKKDENLFLKKFIVTLGLILLVFIGLFTYKMYSTSPIHVTANITQPVITGNAESQTLLKMLDSRITTIESNVNIQLESYAANTSFVNQQVSTLYSMFNNSLMVFTIILGFFTLIIAVFGFYISNIINQRYKLIKKSQKITVEAKENIEKILTNQKNDLHKGIMVLDTKNMIEEIREDPELILSYVQILRARKITDDNIIILGETLQSYRGNEQSTKYTEVIASLQYLIISNNADFFFKNLLSTVSRNSCNYMFEHYIFSSVLIKDMMMIIRLLRVDQTNKSHLSIFVLGLIGNLRFYICLLALEEQEYDVVIKSLYSSCSNLTQSICKMLYIKCAIKKGLSVTTRNKLINLANKLAIKYPDDLLLKNTDVENEFQYDVVFSNKVNKVYQVVLKDDTWKATSSDSDNEIKSSKYITEVLNFLNKI